MYNIFTGMRGALTYIHAQGIIHGDVKPANIIVRPNRTGVVLCDFGNASIDDLVEYTGGTPCYIPPEAFYAKRSPHGDVWALGVTMLFVARRMSLSNRYWPIADIRTDPKTMSKMREWQREVAMVVGELPKQLGWLRGILVQDPGKWKLAQSMRHPRAREEHDQRKKLGRLKARQWELSGDACQRLKTPLGS